MSAVVIRGTPYPVVLPKVSDPRLHLAATITSLQVIGQFGFHFQLSIAQILISLATCGVLEVAIAFRKQHVLMWPASALLTGNGVAFILRVPGTHHGDWWSLRGWWIYAGTSAFALLSKYVIKWRGEHVFNPSNIGLVLCFLILGRGRANPLDFWWGPMSGWLVGALAVILAGGFLILSRLKLLWIALAFWITFATGIGIVALSDHAMSARWHLGPITGFDFWWVLVTSPEVLVFLFFMITDPKTAPPDPKARIVYGVALGLLGTILIAGARTEFASKVGLLGALVIVCLAMPLLRLVAWRPSRGQFALAGAVGLAAYTVALVLITGTSRSHDAQPLAAGDLPAITILPSRGVQTKLDVATAQQITHGLVSVIHGPEHGSVRIWLEAGEGQSPPVAVAQLAGVTYRLNQSGAAWTLAQAPHPAPPVPRVEASGSDLPGNTLANVASQVGLQFQQGSFRFGMSNDYRAMMGGGVCWLDYNNDGWLDLFAVNSYSSADTAAWEAHGGLPRTALFENSHGTFRDVSRSAHADLAVQGDGCVAGDLNGDGRTDLVVTTTQGIDLLWNDGNGKFTEGAAAAGLLASGWFTGATIADVNGDGRPDVFVAGYADSNEPVAGSLAGFPTNLAGVRDRLYLNEVDDRGRARFREVGVQAGLEPALPRHGLGAVFTDYNGDGRPDLYVANDEDPNQLYENIPWPGGAKADPAGLGFRFEERASAEGVDDAFAGMGIATQFGKQGKLDLFVSNSRNERSAAFRQLGGNRSPAFANARLAFDPALGTDFAGWGASFVDLSNSGAPDLVLTAGAIPVTSLGGGAEQLRLLVPTPVASRPDVERFGDARGVLGAGGLRLNGRGLAAADASNDGRMDVAINTIGGKLVFLRPSGPSGHWLDVELSRFSPGAVVTAVLPNGRRLVREIQAGSSYLSSEDPRAHFGLGAATSLRSLIVRYPWGGRRVQSNVAADRVVRIASPPPATIVSTRATRSTLANCTPAPHDGRSVARIWNDEAIQVLRLGDASEPVQARDLFDLSTTISQAWHAVGGEQSRETAISYAAYRLLVWRASYGANLDRAFALLSGRLRALCLSADFTRAFGSSAAELGNRIATTAIAAGGRDGSHEALHYDDPSYTPLNGPLVVATAGSTVHDATFWQPLALSQKAAQGGGSVPADVQVFLDSQWGNVRTFAPRVEAGPLRLADPSSAAYKQTALAAIRATSQAASPNVIDASPLGWNRIAAGLPAGAGAARLAHDVRLDVALNGALNDAAVTTWGAKRASQAPRPISMIRYLASNNQLPLASGLVRRDGGQQLVLRAGHWVPGAGWSPLAATPPSPGGVSNDSAFAYAAVRVLRAFTGRSFSGQAAQASRQGTASGTELPADVATGRILGTKIGDLVARRLTARK